MSRGIPAIAPGVGERFRPLRAIPPEAGSEHPYREALLQEVIDEVPEILPLRDFYPHATGSASLGREIPVDLGGRLGLIDNLLVANDGHLVLVETKLFRNPEALREVVAQTLQYGMAINTGTVAELESSVRRGDGRSKILRVGESIADRARSLAAAGVLPELVDDFEDQLEQNIRRGEILLLIVSDAFHTSVERLTRWLAEFGGNSPFNFGLVELKPFLTPDNHQILVPKTLVRTKEVTRHVVIIDVHGPAPSTVSPRVSVQDETKVSGRTERRPISVARPPLTKSGLLLQVEASAGSTAKQFVTALTDILEQREFEIQGKTSTLQYGMEDPSDTGGFIPLMSLQRNCLWSQLPTSLVRNFPPEEFIEYKRRLNRIAEFYRPADVDNPAAITGKAPRYEQVLGREDELVDALSWIRGRIAELMPRAR